MEKPGLDFPLERDDDEAFKRASLNRDVPSAIEDTGASATCKLPSTEQIQVSECGEYGWAVPAFYPTNK